MRKKVFVQLNPLEKCFKICYVYGTRSKMSNPYPHDVHIYLPNFRPNYVNRVRGVKYWLAWNKVDKKLFQHYQPSDSFPLPHFHMSPMTLLLHVPPRHSLFPVHHPPPATCLFPHPLYVTSLSHGNVSCCMLPPHASLSQHPTARHPLPHVLQCITLTPYMSPYASPPACIPLWIASSSCTSPSPCVLLLLHVTPTPMSPLPQCHPYTSTYCIWSYGMI